MTPFPAMVSTPLQIFLGTIDASTMYLALLSQLLWGIALLFIAHLVLRRGVRRLVIQGG
jgi:ABC-2 type transport system permease protein